MTTPADRDARNKDHDGDDDDGGDEGATGDASMRAAILSVFGCGMCFVVAGAALYGLRAGLGVLLGALLATLNLWVFARVGQAFVSRAGNTAPWSVVAVLKLVLLFGGVWVVLKTEVVSPLALAAGYAALPFGVTFASLFGPAPRSKPHPRQRTRRPSKESTRRGRNVIKRARLDDVRNDEPED
jgi:hypothetical protein